MGKIVRRNLKCLSCESSDARQLYEDGTSFCFSCSSFFPKSNEDDMTPDPDANSINSEDLFLKKSALEEIKDYPVRGMKERKITKVVSEFFDVRVTYTADGEIDSHYYPYDGGKAYKVRKLPKSFTWINKSSSLFGMEKFNRGGKRLIITEGEIDALSVAQASMDKYNKIYPVVALSSAVMTKSLLEHRDWIRSFDEVVLCFDNDDAGKKATEEATKIIGIDKAKIVKLSHKDANETLVKDSSKALLDSIFNAATYVPAGIISKEDLWNSLVSYNSTPSLPFPPCLSGFNEKIKGMRPGEITLFISGTGSGKSTMLREIMLHILATTEDKIGVVSLEESPSETARKLAGMVLKLNPAKEEIPADLLKTGFDQVFGDDRVVLLDHQGSMGDSSIVDQLEYMCLVGCKYLFIDHITILVSEGVENLRGNEAQDKVMNDLLRLVKRHPVWIGLVSHLRKTPTDKIAFEAGKLPTLDDIRGSGSIKQISFDILAFARNMTAKEEKKRNKILMRVLKSRFTGLTGDTPGARYDYDTGRLLALDGNEDFEENADVNTSEDFVEGF